MKAQLRVLTGSPGAREHVFSKPEVSIGRHPACDVQFDPEQDLEVSARHAVLRRESGYWIVRDLGSLNGTLINGHRITVDTRLSDTDQIRLGANGPTIEFRLIPETVADTPTPKPMARPPRSTGATGTNGALPAEIETSGVTRRVRLEVAQKTKRLRAVTGGLAVALVVVLAGAAMIARNERRERDQAIANLQADVDRMLAQHSEVVSGLVGEVDGLANALDRSQRELQSLRGQLDEAQASGNQERVRTLQDELALALAALAEQRTAARIDYQQIRTANQGAVAMVWVEFENGKVVTGTGFAVRPDATVITNRHVVTETGTRPRRIGVQFADSEQVFPAEVVGLPDDPTIDLVALRARLRGTVPVVQGFDTNPSSARPGAPVAMIGFPMGTRLPMVPGERNDIVSTTLIAGIVSRTLPDRVQIQGYGAEGASGSPIFNVAGQVIAVLFGGEEESENRIVYGVPARTVVEFLRNVP